MPSDRLAPVMSLAGEVALWVMGASGFANEGLTKAMSLVLLNCFDHLFSNCQ